MGELWEGILRGGWTGWLDLLGDWERGDWLVKLLTMFGGMENELMITDSYYLKEIY